MLNLKALLIKIPTALANWLRKRMQGANRPGFKGNPHRLPRRTHTLAAIEQDLLKTCGIQGIILDLDNTIVSEDDRYVSPRAEAWIAQAKLAGFRFFILSNGKRPYRVKYWSHRLDIPAINPAKKPFPYAFRKAIARMQVNPKQVVVIGDGVHTDVLGAWISGCCSIQVATLPHPLRWWEKIAGKWVQTPYPVGDELWDFDDPTAKYDGKS